MFEDSIIKPAFTYKHLNHESRPDVINFCHAQLSMTYIMLINVKIPTIVDIFTFISMINTTSESLKAGKVLIF